MGLPVTTERARELAHAVAESLHDERAVESLMELLLGIAPFTEEGKEDVNTDDLWSRYCAALTAIEALYTYREEFRDAIREYILRIRPQYDPDEQEVLTKDNKRSKARGKRAKL